MKNAYPISAKRDEKNCGNCYVCNRPKIPKKKKTNPISAERQILDILQQKPATLDDLMGDFVRIFQRKIQEVLIFCLIWKKLEC